MKRLKRTLQILAVNAIILSIGIILIELVFGGWLDTRRLNRLNLIKNYNITFDISHLYESSSPLVTYSRDKYGLRGTHATPDSINLLTVGGSTTDQRYIDDGETWQSVLQQRFEEAGHTVVVANAGVDGQSTFGHIKNFKWWFPHIHGLAPDFILYYIGLNDFYRGGTNSYDDLTNNDRYSLVRMIKEKSALWTLARKLRGAWKAIVEVQISHRSIDFKQKQWTHQALQDDYQFMQSRLNAYAEHLRVLADMTRDFGSKAIFVSQPSRKYRTTSEKIEGQSDVIVIKNHKVNGVDYYHMMRQLDRVTEAIAQEKGAIFVDLASYTDWADADFYDFAHMTPQGAEKVGVLLYEELLTVVPSTETNSPIDKE